MKRAAVDYKKPKKMVRFRFFKEAMDVSTKKAQLIKVGKVSCPNDVWVPKSQVKISEEKEDERYMVIEMPEWLYVRTELPNYTDPEFYTEQKYWLLVRKASYHLLLPVD